MAVNITFMYISVAYALSLRTCENQPSSGVEYNPILCERVQVSLFQISCPENAVHRSRFKVDQFSKQQIKKVKKVGKIKTFLPHCRVFSTVVKIQRVVVAKTKHKNLSKR